MGNVQPFLRNSVPLSDSGSMIDMVEQYVLEH